MIVDAETLVVETRAGAWDFSADMRVVGAVNGSRVVGGTLVIRINSLTLQNKST
jgi:hypothetical protein